MLDLIFTSFVIANICHAYMKVLNMPSFLDTFHNWLINNVKNETLLTWAGLGCEYCFTLFWGIWLGLIYCLFSHVSILNTIPIAVTAAFFSYPLIYIKNNI